MCIRDRSGKALARRRLATLKAGTRRPTLPLAKTVAAGSARLQVTIEDASGNTKVARKTVRVPAA